MLSQQYRNMGNPAAPGGMWSTPVHNAPVAAAPIAAIAVEASAGRQEQSDDGVPAWLRQKIGSYNTSGMTGGKVYSSDFSGGGPRGRQQS